jgi:hypothetical protein
VKLGKAKDPKGVITNVTKTCDKVQFFSTKHILNDGQQIIGNIDVSIIIPVVDNIINLGVFPYYRKNIYCPCWFGLPLCLLFLLTYVLFA